MDGNPAPVLELKGVHTHYGRIEALKGISLTLKHGEIVTLIGANGAGKTTTLMAISGIVKRSAGDIRQKIINYQIYFRTARYKRYQRLWNCELIGFRLLFLAPSPPRLTNLCRLARDMPPSDFVWLTDQTLMFEQGLSAKIWARGGKEEGAPQSLLGNELACSAPVPFVKP